MQVVQILCFVSVKMAAIYWCGICILQFLFISSSYAHTQIPLNPTDFEELNDQQVLGPHELFGNPFGDPNDYTKTPVDDGDSSTGATRAEAAAFNAPVIIYDDVPSAPSGSASTPPANDVSSGPSLEANLVPNGLGNQKGKGGGNGKKPKVVITTAFKGKWELVSQNSGVSAMHTILLPKINKVLMFDSSIWKISNVKLNGECHLVNKTTGEKDCWAHSVLFDINSYQITPLLLKTDTWCSSGGLNVDGNLVSTGGFQGGANSVRYLDACLGCGWREYPGALAARRWYSTQAALPDGSFIVVGGRESFSYEYIPREGARNAKPIFFKFLQETNDPEENNLYPFVHLNTDGKFFIFANSRSILLDPKTQQIVREFPELKGARRSYPATGLSVLLPIKLYNQNPNVIPAEVLICGGSAHKDSYSAAEKGTFYTALRDCARMRITDPNPVWKSEIMPSARVMGDAMLLPTGDVLLLGGAQRGASGWGFAREPNFTPVLYNPTAKMGNRFSSLTPSNIPRVYHSTAVVLPSGKVLVSGSNTNNGYLYKAMFPTELRVEYFSPPYLAPELAKYRPQIIEGNSNTKFGYGQTIKFQIKLEAQGATLEDVDVTMNSPPFTTHGVSMSQRLVKLALQSVESQGASQYNIVARSPPSGAITPPGYYMLSVIYRGVPSVATWVQIK